MAIPSIGVVIPLYQSGPWIEECLQSVLRQTVKPNRIIVVNDGSTDDGPQRVRKIAIDSSVPIILESQSNAGQAAARNFGLSRIYEEYVAFLDADDVWAAKKLEIQVGLLQSSGYEAVTCGYAMGVGEDPKVQAFNFRWTSDAIHAWAMALGAGPALMSTLLVRTRFAQVLDGFREDMSIFADLDFSIRMKASGTVTSANAVLVKYRQHEHQIHRNSDVLVNEAKYFATQQLNDQDSARLIRNLRYLQILRELRTAQTITSKGSSIARSLANAPGIASFLIRRRRCRSMQRIPKNEE